MPDDDLDLKAPEIILATDLEIPAEGTRTPDEQDSLLGMLARQRHPELQEKESPEERPAREGEEAPPKFEPKHKTWEETEKARQEGERLMHEATTKAAQAERETEGLRQRLAEKERPPEKTSAEVKQERIAQFQVVTKAASKKALSIITSLDDFDPEYEDKVSGAWGEALAEAMAEGGGGVSKEEVAREVARQVRAEQDTARTRAKAVELAGKAGLNMEEGSEDSDLFWDRANVLPPEFDGKPLEEQVGWAVEEARKQRKPTPGLTAEQQDLIELGREFKAKQAQKENAVLGKGGNHLKPTKEPQQETYSMGSLLRQQREARQKRSST